MNELWFKAKLSDLRGHIEALLEQELTNNQRIALGAELSAHAKTIIDHFTLVGLMYRNPE